jgi:hypothetical protein
MFVALLLAPSRTTKSDLQHHASRVVAYSQATYQYEYTSNEVMARVTGRSLVKSDPKKV